MRWGRLLVATALVAFATSASAADLGPPVYDAAPEWRWTGCYAGGHVGGAWTSQDKWIVRTQGGAFEGQSLGGHDADGVIGGVQAGCDYQTASGIVVGVQGDYGWTDASGSHPSAREFGVFYHSDVEGLGSVTARLGYAFGRFLAYAKAGAAWERVDYSASTIITGVAYTASETRSGWTVGGGGEYAVTDTVSIFAAYDHFDFGTDRVRFIPQLPGLPIAFLDIEDRADVVRAGVNIRFGVGH